MVRNLLVAGFYAASVLAAPAQDAAQVGAAPAGWGDRDRPSSGDWYRNWPKLSRPDADADESVSSWFNPSSSSGGNWRGSKGNSGSSSSAVSSWWSPSSSSENSKGSGGFMGGLFGGSQPKPSSGSSGSWGSSGSTGSWGSSGSSGSSSSSSGSSWWKQKPKPESDSSESGSWWKQKPKPESDSTESGSWWKQKPKPEEASKPEPALPKPEPAQPQPDIGLTDSAPASPLAESSESSEAAPAPAQPKPEPAQPKPVPAQPKPAPAQPKSSAAPAPKPALGSSSSSSGASSDSFSSGATDLESTRKRLWQPKVGTKWQIILDGVPDTKQPTLKPLDAPVWDIDLWDASAADIAALKKQGKKVICYFSAGTSESWRSDNHKLEKYNLGGICADDRCTKYWGGENWVDIKSNAVWQVMKERIKMASEKGCDAIDPDNMDGYDNMIKNTKTGAVTKFSENDSVKYLKYMADEAAKLHMSTGLKNSLSIIPKISNFVQFAVNEECGKVKECAEYQQLLSVGKPVFHIEYTGGTSGSATTKTTYKDQAGATKKYCNPLREAVSRFSTIIKAGETLSNQYLYCDGKPADFTPMASFTDKKLGRGKGNFADVGDDSNEGSEVESREWFAKTSNSTILAEQSDEQSANSTIVQRGERSWAVRRRHRRAVMVDF